MITIITFGERLKDAETVEVEFVQSVAAKDWVVLEFEARTKYAMLRPRLIFTNGDPVKALEEADSQ
ncbi:MAG: hypothetical protein QXI84_09205 [Thermofilaceae archaeon]